MLNKFVVCIPVYNNPQTVHQVIEKALSITDFPVVVIDDGSDSSVENEFLKTHQNSDRLYFIRHSENRGKGEALKTAFQFSLQKNWTHIITIDADGQHDPDDIPQLVQASLIKPWSLILGDRNMQTANVPGSSTFGKKFSNFWIQYQTNLKVGDSQSGFRIYPLFHIQNLNLISKHYDFEVEILTRLIWKGVNVENVPIRVTYFSKDKRVSHFHKIKDNFRITIANTHLTIGTLLHEKTSPFESALSFSLGILIGTTPLFGLHTGLAMLFSFLLRLNFIYMWIGTNISFPPLIPFLVLGSAFFGRIIYGQEPSGAFGLSQQWFVGSFVLGLVLGMSSFIGVYFFKSRFLFQNKSDKAQNVWSKKKPNNFGILILKNVLRLLGLRAVYFCLYFVVAYYFLFNARARRSIFEYWSQLNRELHLKKTFFQLYVKVYFHIYEYAKILVERHYPPELINKKIKFVLDDSIELLVRSLNEKDGRGSLFITSHTGNWEMASTFFAKLEHQQKLTTVKFQDQNEKQTELARSLKGKTDMVQFNQSEFSLIKLREQLMKGNIIGIMGDRPVSPSCELRIFLGRLALFDTTPYRLAITCKSKIFYMHSMKISDHTYKLFSLESSLSLEKLKILSKDEAVDLSLNEYIAFLETILKEYPNQWYNFFPFWSEVPHFIKDKS